MKSKSFLKIFLILLPYLLLSDDSKFLQLDSDKLILGEKLKESGEKLISLPFGLTLIKNNSILNKNNNTIIINVHGTRSKGYEWVSSLKKLSNKYNNTFFYRHDWNICPDSSALILSNHLLDVFSNFQNADSLVVFGHSSGGIVIAFLASKLHLNIPININTIASPLTGYGKLASKCELDITRDGYIKYPSWDKNIFFHQWRTQFEIDNAFNKMDYDPQDLMINNSEVTRLPSTINGRRLGHNWSITWVIDEFLKIPHLQ